MPTTSISLPSVPMTHIPPSVVVDGKQLPNPHVVRDSSGNVQRVYCRAMAIGYSKFGIPTVVDRTVSIDMVGRWPLDILEACKKLTTKKWVEACC